MKHIKIILVIVAVLVAAYFGYVYFKNTAEAPTVPTNTNTAVTEDKFGNAVSYSCANEKVLVAWFSEKAAKVALREDQVFALPFISLDAEDNYKYADQGDKMVLWVKDQNAYLEQNGTTTFAGCRTL